VEAMSLSGHLAGAAASHAVRGAGQQVSQAIGKPLDGLSSSAATSSGHPGHSDINWVDFNYPPVLRLIHYSSDELPSSLSGLVRCMNISFVVTCVACVLNLFDTLVVHFGAKTPGRWLLQSLIHLLLLPMAAGAVFYSGYRGLAEPDSTLSFRYRVGQPLLAFGYFLFAVIPAGCLNGFSMLGQMGKYGPDGHGYWTFAIIAESFLWLGNCILACLNAFRAERYDAHGTGRGTDSRF